MVKRLSESGVRELGHVRRRVQRLYGMDRISFESHNALMDLIQELEEAFIEADKEEESGEGS